MSNLSIKLNKSQKSRSNRSKFKKKKTNIEIIQKQRNTDDLITKNICTILKDLIPSTSINHNKANTSIISNNKLNNKRIFFLLLKKYKKNYSQKISSNNSLNDYIPYKKANDDIANLREYSLEIKRQSTVCNKINYKFGVIHRIGRYLNTSKELNSSLNSFDSLSSDNNYNFSKKRSITRLSKKISTGGSIFNNNIISNINSSSLSINNALLNKLNNKNFKNKNKKYSIFDSANNSRIANNANTINDKSSFNDNIDLDKDLISQSNKNINNINILNDVNKLKNSSNITINSNKEINTKNTNNKEYNTAKAINIKRSTKNNLNLISETSNNDLISLSNKPRILIVDDSEFIRKAVHYLISKSLLFKDFLIIEGKDGIDILNYVIEDQAQGSFIKIIITDENMEYFSGSYAISLLRKLERNKKIKRIFVVSLTAFIDEDNRKNILEKGADMIVAKPLSNAMLKSIYDKYMSIT